MGTEKWKWRWYCVRIDSCQDHVTIWPWLFRGLGRSCFSEEDQHWAHHPSTDGEHISSIPKLCSVRICMGLSKSNFVFKLIIVKHVYFQVILFHTRVQIWGIVDYCRLGCDAMWSSGSSTFQMNVLLPSSRSKSKASNRHCLLVVWFTLLPWIWRQYVPPKCWTSTGLHGVTSQKTVLFTVTAVKTSNPTRRTVFQIPGVLVITG